MTKSDNNSSETEPQDEIEQVFALIKAGKDMKKTDLWGSANKFAEARTRLELLATEHPRSTEEEKQVAALYKKQAWEYLKESRRCLIEAMSAEKERDEKEESTTISNLTDDESIARLNIFSLLFSRKVQAKPEEITMENQMSLEERLRNLNASIPSGFKTSEERMNDLNRGLNRLGLSLYEQKTPFSRFIEDSIPKDEDEQIGEIMAQAKDEVNFENIMAQRGMTTTKTADDDNSLSGADDDDSEENQGDELLDDERLAVKKIRRRLVKAQVKLAELVALIDEAEALRDKEDREEEADLTGDDDSSDNISEPDSETIFSSAKTKLRGARKDLKIATSEWP